MLVGFTIGRFEIFWFKLLSTVDLMCSKQKHSSFNSLILVTCIQCSTSIITVIFSLTFNPEPSLGFFVVQTFCVPIRSENLAYIQVLTLFAALNPVISMSKY